jgi:hypothetical protein
MTTFTARLLTGAVVAGAALLLTVPTASADTAAVAGSPSAPDATAANQAAGSAAVLQQLNTFFAHGAPTAAGKAHPQAEGAAPASASARVLGNAVPVYYLNPAFVAAKSASVPVATFQFMATEAVSSNGQQASVWTVRDQQHANAWIEVNIASGANETDYAAAAAKDGPGAIAFEEPQIHAWYSLHNGHVRPLNSDATRAVGAQGVTVAAYQKLVNGRYGDKLPGSAYANQHLLGGFGPSTVKPAIAAAPDSQPTGAIVAGSAGGLLALVGFAGTRIWRRRNRILA